MRIKVGKYVITDDQYCYIINEDMTTTTGKNPGSTYLKPLIYPKTLCQVAHFLMKQELIKSEAETFHDLHEDIMAAEARITTLLQQAGN